MDRTHNQRIVEEIAVEDLKLSVRQARKHPERQITALAESIRRFGFTVPLLVDDGGKVLAGHGRLLAAKRLAMSSVPCLRIHHLSEAEKRAYVIADNRLAELAEWDRETLAGELQDLGDFGFPVTLTGFDLPEIEFLLDEVKEASTEPQADAADEVPELRADSVARPGDVWTLGRHTLFCGDARDPGAYVRLMGADEAAMIFTDPPFNRSVLKDLPRQGRARHREFAMASGEMTSEQFAVFLAESLGAMTKVCRNGAIAFACIDWRGISEMSAAGRQLGLELKNVIVWNKTNGGMGQFYRSQHELVFAWKVGSKPHINNFGLGDKGRSRTNVWTYAGVNTFKSDRSAELERHPTSKPVALVADALKDVSHRGDIVLDPFGGSGTTLIAAQKVGRIARVIEIDPHYCDVIIRRFETTFGTFAWLAGTELTFDEVARERATSQAA